MTPQTKLSFDRFVRIIVSLGLVLSVLGTPMAVSVARAQSPSAPVNAPADEPKPSVTPVMETTPTLEPTPVVEPVTPVSAGSVETPTVSSTPVWQILLGRPKAKLQALGVAAETGARLQTPDARVKLEFPAQALVGTAEVRYGIRHLQSVTQPEQTTSLIEFDLEATQTNRLGQPEALTHFQQPLTLTVNLNGLLDLNHVPEGYYVYLYTLTPEGTQSPVWPLQIDHSAGTVSAQIEHFSGWGVGIAPGTPGIWEFHYTPPEVALYAGGVTQQIAFEVPAGRHGLQPNLGLSYNSAALNGLSGGERGTRDWTRGGEVGGFWNLNGFTKIAREKWDRCKWVDRNHDTQDATCLKDVFTLIINGTGYELVPATPNLPYGRYYAVGGPDLYIYRNSWCLTYSTDDGECTSYATHNEAIPSNQAKEYWTVRTPDGTEIRLGYNADSEQVTGDVCNPSTDPNGANRCRRANDSNSYGMGYKGEYLHPANHLHNTGDTTPYLVPRAWWADKWTDQSGNVMEASYYTYWYDTGERVTPKEIKYNNTTSGYLSRVKFEGQAGDGVTPPDNEPVIDRVEMYTKDASGVEQLVRKYLFTRQVNYRPKWVGSCENSWCHVSGGTCGSGGSCTGGVDYGNIPSYFEVLKTVQEVSGSGASLPARTFDYVWRDTTGWNDIQQLSSVDNGYGGITTFTYGGVLGGGYCNTLGCNDAVVTSRKISAGAGTPDQFTTYDYDAVCVDAPWTNCASRATQLCEHCNNNAYARIAGFGIVTATQWSDVNQTTALARSKHYFKNANPAWFLGKEYKVQTLDPANNNAILAVQDTTWSGASDGNVWWAYVADQTNTRFSGGIGDSTRKSYFVGNFNETGSEYDYGAGLRVLNAGFDMETGSLASWTTYYSGLPMTPTTTGETSAFAGRYALKFNGSNIGGVYQDVSGLVPGATYKARVRVKWSSPSATGTFRLWLHDTNTNGANGQVTSQTNPGDSNWRTVEVTYPADWTGAVRLHLDYRVASNESIYVDEVELARLEDIGDETSTHYGYVYNTASNEWIIAKNNWKNEYTGITQNVGGTALKFQTLLCYDDASAYNAQTLTQGRLTKKQEGLGSTWRTVQYGYDTVGNTTSITDAEGRVSTAEYDTNQYNAFVTRVALAGTNPVQQRTYTWDKVLGGMLTQTGPDGAVTSYAYDTFGRLKKVAQPPDTLAYPTVEYAYYDGGDKPRTSDASGNPVWPFMIGTFYRAQAGVAACSGGWGNWERKYMDGLGRVIESQGPGPNWDCTNTTQQGQEVVQYTLYNALGQTVEASVPYQVPQYVSQNINGYILTPYRTPDLSQARSKTVYDTLGANVRAYGLDGTAGTTLNINRLGVTEGATGQIGLGFTDGRGLLTAVDQTVTTWSDNFSDNVLTGWGNAGGSEAGGTARIPGTGTDWTRRIERVSAATDGQGIAFSFKSDGTSFAPLLETGTFGQADYRRWGLLLSASNLVLDTYEGTNHQSSVLLPFKANTWYRAVFKVDGNGEFVVALWERDNPAASAMRREKRGANWVGKTWRFLAASYAGTLQLDDYAELNFKTARYGYDPVGNLTNVWDVTGNNIAQMNYDAFKRKTNMYDKDMGSWTYVYNNVDTLTAQQDANGQWTCFYTDNLDRITGIKYMTGATNPCVGQTVYDTTYGYDANGDVGYRTSASNANAATTWSYDERGQVTQENKTVPAYLGRIYTTTYIYDSMNRVKSVTYPSGEVVNSTYYAYRPQLSAVNSAASPAGYGVNYVSNILYDAQGRVTSRTKGNGLPEAWNYDPLNGKLIQHTAGGLLDMRYGYDPVGNTRAVHDAVRHDGTNETVRYQYDDLERLTGYGTTTLGSVTVRAKGTDNGGLPVMQLRVNGVKVGQWTVTTAYADYTAPVPLSGDDRIDVIFTNDAGARDLYVDYVVVGGVTVQAEDTAQVVYDKGSGSLREALDGLDVIPGQELMAWPGALRLRVKSAWTPAAMDTFSYDDTGNLTMGTESRTYGATPTGSHLPCVGTAATMPHAVSQIGSKTFMYDCVGNMLTRQEGAGSTTYIQAWTQDNKLKSVSVNGQTTEFKYDADGNRVMRLKADGSRTYYVSGQFEVECPALAQPASLTPANGTVLAPGAGTITWAGVSGASRYLLRVDDLTTPWIGTGDIYEDNLTGTSYAYTFQAGHNYAIWVHASNACGNYGSPAASNVTVSVPPAPAAPSNLSASAGTNQIALTWTDNSTNEEGFKIEISYDGVNWIEDASVGANVTSYNGVVDCGSMEDVFYRVRAFNAGGTSGYSNTASATTLPCTPPPTCKKPPCYAPTVPYLDKGARSSQRDLLGKHGLAAPTRPATPHETLWKQVKDFLTHLLAPLPALATPPSGETWRTYYDGAVREKTATADSLYYVYGDALSSASLTTNSTGGWVGEQRYKPFGEPRLGFPQGDLHTDHRFTGQRSEEANLGSLYDYGARMYSPVLGRFLSADTVVPDTKNPQQFNRYAYGLNNPVKYTDPSGHMVINEAGGGGCGRRKCYDLTAYLALAMSAHGDDPRLQKIAEGINPSMPPVMSLGAESLGLQYLGLKLGGSAGAYKQFNDLEGGFKEWDIKRAIQRDLGDGIILCGETCDWYDYSTPGNIHFGYVAGRAGIDHEIAAVAGGVLEQVDLFMQEGKINLGYCNWTLKCDNPQDQAAVDFGYALAEKYPTGITPVDLKKELTVDKTNQFQRPISRYFHPLFPAHPQQTSYGPDEFNWRP